MLRYKFLFFIFISHNIFAGGPWASPQFGGYFEVGGNFTLLSTVTDNTYQLYTEFGLTKRLSFKGVLPFKQVSSPRDISQTSNNNVEFGKLSGLSNIILGLKYQIFKKLPISVGFNVALNTFNRNGMQGLRTGYEGYTFRPVFAIGGAGKKNYYYAEIKPGFSTNNYSNDLTIILEYGGQVQSNVYIAFYLQRRIPFSNGNFNITDDAAFSFTGFYIDQQNYTVLGPKVSIGLGKNWGLSTTLFYVLGQAQASSIFSGKMGIYYNLVGKKNNTSKIDKKNDKVLKTH